MSRATSYEKLKPPELTYKGTAKNPSAAATLLRNGTVLIIDDYDEVIRWSPSIRLPHLPN